MPSSPRGEEAGFHKFAVSAMVKTRQNGLTGSMFARTDPDLRLLAIHSNPRRESFIERNQRPRVRRSTNAEPDPEDFFDSSIAEIDLSLRLRVKGACRSMHVNRMLERQLYLRVLDAG